MTMESPDSKRLHYGTSITGADEVSFRSRSSPIFLLFWLVAWVAGLFFVGNQLLTPGDDGPFVYVWLVAWLVGGGLTIFGVLWLMFGVETLTIDSMTLRHTKEMFGFKREKQYMVHEVSRFRWIEQPAGRRRARHTALEMNYGTNSVSLFNGIEGAEAEHVIDALGRRLNLKTDASQ